MKASQAHHIGEEWIQEGLANLEGWSDMVQDLARVGFTDEEIGGLLRPHEAWTAEAREMKAAGYPYDEILFHLRTLKATWADAARALLRAGLSPADMLRVVLPATEGDGALPVIEVAWLEAPGGTDEEEVRGVLAYFGFDEGAMRNPHTGSPRHDETTQRRGFQA